MVPWPALLGPVEGQEMVVAHIRILRGEVDLRLSVVEQGLLSAPRRVGAERAWWLPVDASFQPRPLDQPLSRGDERRGSDLLSVP
eukprot:718860-Hanusia_phi.AAC.3